MSASLKSSSGRFFWEFSGGRFSEEYLRTKKESEGRKPPADRELEKIYQDPDISEPTRAFLLDWWANENRDNSRAAEARGHALRITLVPG